ncbi:Cytochrome c, monohaem [gamma proteobacterium HdN1]|nr:Cytochrome c, monohaem [gamma proteobacterium HdN1]
MKKLVLLATAASLLGAVSMANAADPAALAQSKNCLACHSIDKKVMGPAYKDVAAKFKDDKNAEATLIAAVKNGSSGVWGPIPMPPNNVTDEEAKILVDWILSQK